MTTDAPEATPPAHATPDAVDDPKTIEARRMEHLKMLQTVIARMATNSFQLKGWAIGLVSALGAVAGWKDKLAGPMWAAFVVALLFSYLDTWFLRQEKLFRKLFEHARDPAEKVALFDMNASQYRSSAPWWKSFWSPTIAPLYLTLAWGAGCMAWRWSKDACALEMSSDCPSDAQWGPLFGCVVLAPLVLHALVSLLTRRSAGGQAARSRA